MDLRIIYSLAPLPLVTISGFMSSAMSTWYVRRNTNRMPSFLTLMATFHSTVLYLSRSIPSLW